MEYYEHKRNYSGDLELCLSVVWCGVGDLRLCDGGGGGVEELVWETLLGGLEPCPALCNVVHMEGEE
jgi:hypothetical protein